MPAFALRCGASVCKRAVSLPSAWQLSQPSSRAAPAAPALCSGCPHNRCHAPFPQQQAAHATSFPRGYSTRRPRRKTRAAPAASACVWRRASGPAATAPSHHHSPMPRLLLQPRPLAVACNSAQLPSSRSYAASGSSCGAETGVTSSVSGADCSVSLRWHAQLVPKSPPASRDALAASASRRLTLLLPQQSRADPAAFSPVHCGGLYVARLQQSTAQAAPAAAILRCSSCTAEGEQDDPPPRVRLQLHASATQSYPASLSRSLCTVTV